MIGPRVEGLHASLVLGLSGAAAITVATVLILLRAGVGRVESLEL